jgi:hypothetical protein
MKTNYIVYDFGGFDPNSVGKNIKEQGAIISAGLGADRYTIPADGLTPALCHWAGYEDIAVWDINGVPGVEAATLDPVTGLKVSETEVTSLVSGTITVVCNGSTITLRAA